MTEVSWPLGFSTLGCPEASVEEIVAVAERQELWHVDLRAHADGPFHIGMPGADRDSWRTTLEGAGIVVTSVASYVRLADDTVDTAAVVADARRHVALADDVGAEAVRVFTGGPGDSDTVQRARDRLSAILDADAGRARVLLETHDTRPRGRDVAAVLDGMPDRVAAIWDAVIPWVAGEVPEETAEALAGRIAMVQVKDVVGTRPVLPGTGIVPLTRILAGLTRLGWSGVLSVEWERAWYPDLPAIDAAITAARAWVATALPGATT
jgi:sugar phosphate isomerase/epimerase